MQSLQEITGRLGAQDAVLVTVHAAEGSVPREEGAWMAVFADAVVGTVGGGHLELQAIEEARRRLAGAGGQALQRFALGPSLGQCCGGVVHLRYERVGAADAAGLASRLRGAEAPLALFGGGHVGKALVTVLGTLHFSVTWIDSRDEVFPPRVPDNVRCEHSDPVQATVDASVYTLAAFMEAAPAAAARRPRRRSPPAACRGCPGCRSGR